MNIDEARCHKTTLSIDLVSRLTFKTTLDRNNVTSADTNIDSDPGVTRTVHDATIDNKQVVRQVLKSLGTQGTRAQKNS
jgi:hypothetical protein